jgi:hypothetical protein
VDKLLRRKKMKKAIVVCLVTMILVITGVANADISVYTSESTFLANANVVSTETFDGYPFGVLGTGTVVVDGITYIGQPSWQWAITPYSGVNPPAFYSYKDVGLDGGSDVLTFADGAWTECIGFNFLKGSTSSVSSKVHWLVVATDSYGQQAIVPILISQPSVCYVGFIATTGIVSVSVTDILDGFGCSWDYDNVSRGEIVPEPCTLMLLGLGAAVLRKRR